MSGSDALVVAAVVVSVISSGMLGIYWLIKTGIQHMDDYSDWNDHV